MLPNFDTRQNETHLHRAYVESIPAKDAGHAVDIATQIVREQIPYGSNATFFIDIDGAFNKEYPPPLTPSIWRKTSQIGDTPLNMLLGMDIPSLRYAMQEFNTACQNNGGSAHNIISTDRSYEYRTLASEFADGDARGGNPLIKGIFKLMMEMSRKAASNGTEMEVNYNWLATLNEDLGISSHTIGDDVEDLVKALSFGNRAVISDACKRRSGRFIAHSFGGSEIDPREKFHLSLALSLALRGSSDLFFLDSGEDALPALKKFVQRLPHYKERLIQIKSELLEKYPQMQEEIEMFNFELPENPRIHHLALQEYAPIIPTADPLP